MNNNNTHQKMTAAIEWLVQNWERQPSLAEAALHVGMESTMFQKKFTDYVGLSPKRFVQTMTHKYARDLLEGGDVITLDAAYQSGLSGNGRLHDLFVTVEAATPGEVRAKGAGMTITYGAHTSPYGELIVAKTERGICYVGMRRDGTLDRAMGHMKKGWANATFVEDDKAVANDAEAVVDICAPLRHAGLDPGSSLDPRLRGNDKKVKLHLFGTNFQIQVWKALLRIPSKHFLSYQGLGAAIGRPNSPRAIGNAVGANPVTLLIPCHRVIQKTGMLNNYGWGSARKKALLAVECA